MRGKRHVVGLVLVCGCVIGLIIWGTRVPSPNAKELLGLTDIEASNVESIRFIKNRETQQVWQTSDPELIAEVLGQYDSMILRGRRGGLVGAYLWYQLHLKSPVNGKSDVVVTLYDSSWYAEGASSDGPMRSYRVRYGGFTGAEWEAVLDACERIR